MKFKKYISSSKEPAERLVLFFHGWGMAPDIPADYSSTGDFDLIVFYDYSDLNISSEIESKLKSYNDVLVIAWSYGVWVAGQVFDGLQLKGSLLKIAINGTLEPVHPDYGIVPDVFQKTLEALREGEENRDKFYRRMFQKKSHFETFMKNPPGRELLSQIRELEQLGKAFSLYSASSAQNWDRVIVSTKDRIIPSRSQLEFWGKEGVPVVQVDGGHYPFIHWENWKELLEFLQL